MGNLSWKAYVAGGLMGAAGGAATAAAMNKSVAGGAGIGLATGLVFAAGIDATDTMGDKAKAELVKGYKAMAAQAKEAAKAAANATAPAAKAA